MPKHSNDNARERIVIIENGADLTPDVVVREVVEPPVPEYCRDCRTLLVRPASIFVGQCLRCSAEQEDRLTGRRTSIEALLGRRRAA